MKLVILESPFAGATDEECDRNLIYARSAMRHCFDRGEAPFAPHLLYTQEGVLDDNVPSQRSLGINAGHEWLRAVDYMVVYQDFGISDGMKKGIQRAQIRRIPIKYRRLFG